jgi:hypothetical protein
VLLQGRRRRDSGEKIQACVLDDNLSLVELISCVTLPCDDELGSRASLMRHASFSMHRLSCATVPCHIELQYDEPDVCRRTSSMMRVAAAAGGAARGRSGEHGRGERSELMCCVDVAVERSELMCCVDVAVERSELMCCVDVAVERSELMCCVDVGASSPAAAAAEICAWMRDSSTGSNPCTHPQSVSAPDVVGHRRRSRAKSICLYA